MIRVVVFVFICSSLHAQIRSTKLVIERRQNYVMEHSDIIVADTLIMLDSSRITLNRLKKENYIRAQVFVIGKNCVIDGRGSNGKNGPEGASGRGALGPCQNGQNGRNGVNGLDGTPANDLFLYIDKIDIQGDITINLFGGDGGNGGNGGN